jgi:DNA-binding response OmpR family regulator
MEEVKKKVLIIDDDISTVNEMSLAFNSIGCEVFYAYDGEAGLRSAKVVLPDLIILDINMPKLDGISMLNLMRKESFGSKIPVILLSVFSNEILTKYSLEATAQEYLNISDNSIENVIIKAAKYLK